MTVSQSGEDYLDPCPNRIAIIGGGRWARVLTEVLCGLVPQSTKISLHTFNNYDFMAAWVSDNGFIQDIYVSHDWPRFDSENIDAMIVVNAARDHEVAIEKGLSACVPVLVEKPVTLSHDATRRLVNLARKNNTIFASAHIFTFARYIENFSQLVTNAGRIKSINVDWMDPALESRYGEQKQYDPGLPIYVDWLPHVLSIIWMLTAKFPHKCKSFKFSNGGAAVELGFELEYMQDIIPCSVKLERNGITRKRIIEVYSLEKNIKIDFSSEPGTITYESSMINGDPEWFSGKRPAAQMLTSFLQSIIDVRTDRKLDINVGMSANKVIDEVSIHYKVSLLAWLKSKLVKPVSVDNDLQYAFREMLFEYGYPAQSGEVEIQMDRLKKVFNSNESSYWYKKLFQGEFQSEIIRIIANG